VEGGRIDAPGIRYRLGSGTADTLSIVVTAPDATTTTTYNLAFLGNAGITINNPSTTYLGLGFPSSASIVQGQAFAAETGDATLDAIPSGWAWYFDGSPQGGSSKRYVLSPSDTSSMLGTYQISAAIASGGVSYSGRIALTVSREYALNYLPSSATVTTLSTLAPTNNPYDICRSGSKLFFVDPNSCDVFAYDLSSGLTTVFAGDGTSGYKEGIGTSAKFRHPMSIATDGTYLYVGEEINNCIRKICIATSAVTTLATGFTQPDGLWTDGTSLYVCDRGTNLVSTVDIASGAVATLAGSGAASLGDGNGTSASFNSPYRICGDGANLYVTEYGSGAVRKIVVGTRAVTTIVMGFNHPAGIVFDGSDLYLCDADNSRLVKLSLSGVATYLGYSGLNFPKGITTDGTKLYVADTDNHRIVELQQ